MTIVSVDVAADVAYVVAHVGNGWRYTIMLARLPCAMEGGHPDTHIAVTVFAPLSRTGRTYALLGYGTQHTLCLDYFAAKFELDAGRQTTAQLLALVGWALGRPTDVDVTVVSDQPRPWQMA